MVKKVSNATALVFGALTVISIIGCGGGGGLSTPPPPGTIKYKTTGECFSAFIDQDPNTGATLTAEKVEWLLSKVAPYTKAIRTFGSTNGQELIPPRAKALGLRVYAGAWLGKDKQANEREIAALVSLIEAGYVDCAVVGNETLLRGDLTETELIGYIRQVKGKGVPVTTAEVWSKLIAQHNLLKEVDVVMGNFYPYWEGVSHTKALRSLHQQYLQLKHASQGKKVIVGETGWPSQGEVNSDAIASEENAAYYFLNFVSWAMSLNVEYFYFESIDEPWKVVYEGERGGHWGLRTVDGTLKKGMERVYNDEVMKDNWSDGCNEPKVEFTKVPEYGSFDDLEGKVTCANPSNYYIAVYIQVQQGWWSKPFWDLPRTPIGKDGKWKCDITTGGADRFATRIGAFLIPKELVPLSREEKPSSILIFTL